MLFNSYEYIFLFLPVVWLLYIFLQSFGLVSAAMMWLVLASLCFYGYWNPAYLPLILFSLGINFIIGKVLEKKRSKPLLVFGIIINLGLLAYYKYAGFFLETIHQLSGLNMPVVNIVLPLAISFYTFQQIAFLVDVYRGDTVPYNLLDYALFVTFFPQLIAGPIVQQKEMIPQFRRAGSRLFGEHLNRGLFLFFIGLFKKAAVADSFAIWANDGFSRPEQLTFVESWITSLAYTFQLYFDFSGYCDMAIGAALLFNIRLPMNFDSPYQALTIQDFWKRWHMTLNRFLTNYLYIPLGGSRHGIIRPYTNILIVFLLSGIWHGAGWTFILWGLMHGAASVVYRLWKRYGFRLHRSLAWCITFLFVNAAWVFFRADSIQDALWILKRMLSVHHLNLTMITSCFQEIITLLIFLWICLAVRNSNHLVTEPKLPARTIIIAAAASVISLLFLSRVSEFLYFQF